MAVDRCLDRASLRRERGRLLDENLEFARERSLQQRCLEFLSHPDLEWLQERLLVELAAACDAQSAALWLADDKGQLHLRAYRGLNDKGSLPEWLVTDVALDSRILAGAPWLAGEGGPKALWVPLVTGGEVMGVAQLSDPLTQEFSPAQSRAAKTLADFGAVGRRTGETSLASKARPQGSGDGRLQPLVLHRLRLQGD